MPRGRQVIVRLAPPEGIEGSLSKADPLDWYASQSP
jgi:hypothetical protein